MNRTLSGEPRVYKNKLGPKTPAEARAAIAKGKTDPAVVKKRGASALETAVSKGTRQHLSTTSAANAALVDPDKPLTEMQREFAKLWASGESIATACVRAGYADEGFGYRMARMPNVRRLYDAEKAKYEAAAQMTRKKVMDMHLEAFEMAKLMAEPSSMVAAAREIGKMCGYYEPVKLQVTHNHQGEVAVRQLNAMSDSDLLKLITGGGALGLPAPTNEPEDTDEAHTES